MAGGLRRRIAVALTIAALAFGTSLPPAPVLAAARAPLPSDRLHFGLANGPSSLAWMTSSGVPWRYRYTYLAGGLYNNPWPTWQDPALPPGQYALDYMRSSAAAGYIPVLPYYMLLQSHRSSDEATDDYDNLNNPTLMRDYYANFTLLMQKAAEYGGQVMILVEPDLWGYLQQRSGNTVAANVAAAVASSGNGDVAAYPNTVQGFAQALQHLRDAYAPNALLAYHASLWASARDIATDTDPTLSGAGEADKTAAFFNSASPGGWDAVTDDVDDHDAGWWEVTQGTSAHWWDPTNRQVPDFSRYLDWVGELHARTGKPQLAWQVPEGNQHFLTENNTAGHYQDNVAEYFLGHTSDLFAAGLVAVLFGAGNAGQTTNEDTMGDGVTNNGGAPTTDAAGWCSACNTSVSTVADDDGGYLRMAVGRYYAPATLAGAPTGVTAVAGEGAAVVAWQPPASDGNSPITSYSVIGSNGFATNVGGSARSAVVTGLGDGTAVTFTVRANNAVGQGPGAAAAPVTPLATAYTGWLTWYDRASPGMQADNVHLVNPPGGSAVSGAVVMAGLPPITVSLAAGGQTFVSFPAGTIGGPVTIVAGARLVVAQRVEYFQSFNEVDAQVTGRAAGDLWFSWFDRASPGMLNDNVHLVNPGGGPASGVVSVGGASVPYSVGPGAGTFVSFPAGTIAGPVHVHASAGAVLASQRVQYYQTFNEVAGRPSGDASATQWFNWFDLASPGMANDNVHIVNPGATGVTGSVQLGATVLGFSAPAGGGTWVSFGPGVIGGPVVIRATGAVLASQRVQYFGSFNEAPGHSTAEASRSLVMPWYDLASPGMVSDDVHVLNPGTLGATVAVSVAGGPATSVVVGPGGETWVSFPGVIGGPLVVSSDQPVLASQRVQYHQTFNEAQAG